MKRLLKFTKPYMLYVAAAVTALFAATAMELLMPVVMQRAIDSSIITAHPDTGMLKIKVLIYFGLLSGVLVFSFIQVYLMAYTGQAVMMDVRMKLYDHIIRQSAGFMGKTPVGSLVSRITSDVETLNEFFTSVATSILKDVSLVTGVIVTIFFLDRRLAVITVLTIPPVFAASWIFRIKARSAYRRVRTSVSKVNAFLSEHVAGMDIVQMFAREKKSAGEFGKYNSELLKANLSELYVFAFFKPLMNLFTSVTTGTVIYFGASGVLDKRISLGVLIAFISLIQKFYRPVLDFAEKFTILQSAMAGGERIFSLLDQSEQIGDTGGVELEKRIEGKIEFRNVNFSYEKGTPVLKNLSFTVNPGETAAIAGYTGAGKTTIASLLTRMWDADEGEILIDGINIKDISLKSLRETVIPLQQDIFLFAGTIRENISMGRDLNEEEILNASIIAQAHPFIEKLPGGYDFVLSERASNISTGQRQLISFARVIARNPPVVILDEATASIDTETERLIQKAIEKLMENRTSIVIAHRLSTIKHADRILVLSSGELAEQGTHEELIRAEGLYYNLYKLQYETFR